MPFSYERTDKEPAGWAVVLKRIAIVLACVVIGSALGAVLTYFRSS